jgi:16S rRNA (guanine527-N7)-methyltransferase
MKVQDLEVSDKFDVITSRAFADLSDFLNWSGHLLADGGKFIALKGTAPAEEQERIPEEWKISGLQPLQVPRLGAERHLIFVEKSRAASA